MVRDGKPARVKTDKSPGAEKSRPESPDRDLQERLTAALEQQIATSEILRIISSARTDVQPVFDTIAANALRLCDARFSAIYRFDGELIHIAAFHNLDPTGAAAFHRAYPCPPSRSGSTQRAILTRSIVHIADTRDDPEYLYQDVADAADYRSVLSVPMVRDGEAIGAISVFRAAPRPFPSSQIELLKTFADQAVIAIDNVRRFHETREALDQQIATGEILRIISQSRTDVQPVFDTIVAAALKLCRAGSANVFTFDGKLIHLAAYVNADPAYVAELKRYYPQPPGRGTAAARAILTGSVVALPDVARDPEYADVLKAMGGGFRSVLAVPLLQDGKAIGGIAVGRYEPGRFPAEQVTLLQTFADQAVIAIENVRLFTELEARNRALTEALEQQTATSEILRVISRSPTDVQPVFDTIVAATMKLCGARAANVFTFDGELIHLAALVNVNPEYFAAIHAVFPRPPSRETAVGRAILRRSVVVIPDVLDDPEYAIGAQTTAGGFRSVLAVPLIRDEKSIGAIIVGAARTRPFPRGADRAAPDLRRPGGHRDRERAPVHGAGGAQPRTHRGSGAADGDQRDPAGDEPVADRCATGLRHHRAERRSTVRSGRRVTRRASTASFCIRWPTTASPRRRSSSSQARSRCVRAGKTSWVEPR